MAVDLHTHSTASDGTLTASEIVAAAAAMSLTAVAIADHDSVEGVEEAVRAGRQHRIAVIPAVEMSAAVGPRSIHILGYFVDHTNEELLGSLSALRDDRMERAGQIVAALAAAGYEMDLEDVLRQSSGGALGRAHIANALVRLGHVPAVEDAFDRLIGRGKPFYISKRTGTPEAVVSLIRRAGGIAVLAHPGVTGADDLVAPLVKVGLQGIEAFHAEHSQKDRQRYASMASARGLLVTGGSDFHGPGQAGGRLGEGNVPDEVVQALIAVAGERAGEVLD